MVLWSLSDILLFSLPLILSGVIGSYEIEEATALVSCVRIGRSEGDGCQEWVMPSHNGRSEGNGYRERVAWIFLRKREKIRW